MNYDGTDYYFRKNIFGDIIEVFASDGTSVASFVYDAYGKVLTESGTMASKVPFRYRGYYYDQETRLYYLQSRYYDPATGRFISPDSIEYLAPDSPQGLNLYAYCWHNPVMFTDESGHFAIGSFLISLAVSWLVSSVASYYLGEHLVSGASSIFGGVQTIATGIAMLAYGPVGWLLGSAAIILGCIDLAFGGAEIQQHFTGKNWINDIGITGNSYTGLYMGASFASSLVTIAGTGYMNSNSGKLAHEIQQNAKFWDKGTFHTRYSSLKYHYGIHANGLSPTQYTQYALDFSSFNSSSFKYTYNYKYNNLSWYFKDMFGVGGYYTSTGKILTFWF